MRIDQSATHFKRNTMQVSTVKISDSYTDHRNKGDLQRRRSSKFAGVSDISAIYPRYKNSIIRKEEDETDISSITVFQAAREGLAKELDLILQEHPKQVNTTDSSGMTPLHVACKSNSVKIAEVLIRHKADVNMEVKPYHVTPLHITAKMNSSDVCRLLVKSGANVSSRDCKRKTPLHYATRRGNMDVARILLEEGKCDVNVCDEDLLNSLHEAIMHKQANVVPLLLKFGADIFVEDVNGSTAYHFAAAEGMVDTMNILLQHAITTGNFDAKTILVDYQDKEGNTPLHLAVQNNKLQAVKELWKLGADVNLKNRCPDFHFTPLHIASVNGDVDITDFLLLHGAHFDCRDKDYMTPLHRAALHNRRQIMDSLIKRGADINAKQKDQLTPLMAACSKGNTEAVKFLLDHAAQIMETDSRSRTALHHGVEAESNAVVEILMEHHGAALFKLQDSSDQTAMHVAAKKGSVEIINTLISSSCPLYVRDEDGQTPLHIAAEFGQDDVIELLIQTSQSELNAEDSDGRTPMMKAAMNGHYNAVYSLLRHGADVCSRDEHSCTTLMLAAKEGQAKVITLLLQNYAEIDVADKLKNTALHMAASEGQLEAVDTLLKKGANATLRNSYGKTPLDVAIENRQSDIAVVILKQANWEDLMNMRDSDGKTPMMKLIEKVPDAAKKVMDKCVKHSKHRKDDVDFTVTYDFKYVDPGPDDPMCKKRRVHLVENMVQLKRTELLSHPLVQNLLLMKWRKFGRFNFYFNLAIYFIYLSALTAYVSVMPLLRTSLLDDVRNCPIYLNDSEKNNQTAIEHYKKTGEYSHRVITMKYVRTLKYFIATMIWLFMIQQLYVLFTASWRSSLLSPFYNLTWAMLISTLILLLPLDKFPCELQWRAGYISSMLSWSTFILYLRGLDKVGIYIVMFEEVMSSLSKVMFLLIVVVMSFSQAFCIILPNTPGFRRESYDIYPIAVLAMMLGELNYIANFVTADTSPFQIDNYIMITIFLIVIPLALMNLLIGIAVGDIEKIQKQAYIKRLGIQIDEICYTEGRAPRSIQRKIYQRYFETKPNLDSTSCAEKIYKFFHGDDEEEVFITEEKEDTTKIAVDEIKADLKKTKNQIGRLLSSQKQTQELVRQLCEQMKVNGKLDTLSLGDSMRTGALSRGGALSRMNTKFE